MITKSFAKDRSQILLLEGKLTCSSVNPKKEAETWVEKNAHKVRFHRNAFVLGAGSGYHLKALVKAFPVLNLTVIDDRRESIEFCKLEHGIDLAGTDFLMCDSLNQISKNPAVLKVLKKKYSVLSFFPACNANLEFFKAAEQLLLGRSLESFRFLLSQRADLNIIDSNIPMPLKTDEMISIKSIIGVLRPLDMRLSKDATPEVERNHLEEELKKLKTLRELVI